MKLHFIVGGVYKKRCVMDTIANLTKSRTSWDMVCGQGSGGLS